MFDNYKIENGFLILNTKNKVFYFKTTAFML